jgi:predicted Zn-dependent peptidase
MPGARSVSAGVWVGVGARDEPEELAGVSHFLEHLLFKGTEDRSARQIAESIDRVGGDMNAFTTKEYTAYYTRLPGTELSLGLEVLGDVLTAPALREVDVESERQVILEELLMDEDSPEDKAHTLLYESLFPRHPLGRETAGRQGDGGRHQPRRRPAVLRPLVPAGHDGARRGGRPRSRRRRGRGRAALPRCRRRRHARASSAVAKVVPLVVRRRRTEQAHLAFGFRGVRRDDPDREALDVLNHCLGGGMSSRLFDEIREQRGLAYAVYSAPSAYADAGALAVYAGTTPANVDPVLDLIEVELKKLVAAGLSDGELAVAKGYLTGSYVLSLEDPSSRMARLGGLLATTGEVRPVSEQLARWAAVDQEAVRGVIDRVLSGPRALAAVGPLTKASLRRAS